MDILVRLYYVIYYVIHYYVNRLYIKVKPTLVNSHCGFLNCLFLAGQHICRKNPYLISLTQHEEKPTKDLLIFCSLIIH